MSEKENPFQKILDSIDSRLKNIESKNAQSPSQEKPTSSNPPHTHSANVLFDCPDCQKEYDAKVSADAVADFKKKVKSMKAPELCEDCGEIYDAEEKDECPSCHKEE